MSRPLEDEDGGSKTDFRPSKGPSLWRPAKRAGNNAGYYVSRIGKKESPVRVPNIADYYDSSRISKKENERTLVRLPWQMGIFSPRLSKRAAPKTEDDQEADHGAKSLILDLHNEKAEV